MVNTINYFVRHKYYQLLIIIRVSCQPIAYLKKCLQGIIVI